MNFYGDYYVGNSFSTQLTLDKDVKKEQIEEIEQKIRSMRPLLYEFVVINLIHTDGNSNIPLFFQTTRSRAYEPNSEDRYLFHVEIGIDGTDGKHKGNWIYGKKHLSCEEVIHLFHEICIERKMPDLKKWNRYNHFFSKDETTKEHKEAQKIKRCASIFSQCVNDKVSGTLQDTLLWETLETLCYDSILEYSQVFFELCQKYNSYIELKRLISYQKNDAVLAAAKADLLYQGKFGIPDLKGAYDLYVHAARTGSLRAGFMVAKAFRDGWFGMVDQKRYEEIVRSIYDFAIQENPLALFALPEVILELSRIEEKIGNKEKAIECCLKWKEMTLMEMSDHCYPSETGEQIVQQLYRLTVFDPADIDLLDLFYLLQSPCKVKIFLLDGAEIKIESVPYEDEIIVKCEKNYFRTIADFFKQYRFNNKRISAYVNEILYIETDKIREEKIND